LPKRLAVLLHKGDSMRISHGDGCNGERRVGNFEGHCDAATGRLAEHRNLSTQEAGRAHTRRHHPRSVIELLAVALQWPGKGVDNEVMTRRFALRKKIRDNAAKAIATHLRLATIGV